MAIETASEHKIEKAMAGGPRTRYEILWLLQQAGQVTRLKVTRGALRKLVGDGALDFNGALRWGVDQGLVRQEDTGANGGDGPACTLTPLGGVVATAYRSGMVAVLRYQAGATGQDRLIEFRDNSSWMFVHDEPRDLQNRTRAAGLLAEMTGQRRHP